MSPEPFFVKPKATGEKVLDKLWAYAYNYWSPNRLISMARPRHCRRVGCLPENKYFKPRGIPLSTLEEITLTIDEFEAIRLADLEALYQEQAAREMKVSRQTFGRIIGSAHKKVGEALVKGKALKIEGGDFEIAAMRKFRCYDCQHTWGLPHGTGRPGNCPSCKSGNIHSAEEDWGYPRGWGAEQGRGFRRGRQKPQQ